MFPLATTVGTTAYTYFSWDSFRDGSSKPHLWLYLLQLFMSLVVGITSAFWVCSGHSLASWRSFFSRWAPRPAYHRPQVKCAPVTRYPPPQQIALAHQPVRQSTRHSHKHNRVRSGGYHRGEAIV